MPHKVSGLLKFFPAPEYIRISDMGLSITDDSLRLLSISRPLLGDKLRVRKYQKFDLAPGVIEAGFIKNTEALTNVLHQVSHAGARFVHVVLPEERTYLFTAVIDKVPKESVPDAIAFILEENVPLKLDNAVFDCQIIGEPSPGKLKVVVSVLSKKSVEFYTDLLRKAGLEPLSFDIESQAIARALVSSKDKSTQLIVSLREKKTDLYIVSEGVAQFTTTLPYTAKEHIKELRMEIERVSRFWNDKSDSKVSKVVLSGIDVLEGDILSDIPNIMETVIPADPWSNAGIDPKSLPDELRGNNPGLSIAVGSALASAQERLARLLPPEGANNVRQDYLWRKRGLLLANLNLAALVAIIGFLPSYVLSQGTLQNVVATKVEKTNDGARMAMEWFAREKAKIASLNPDQKPLSSEIIANLISQRSSGISIVGVNWSQETLSLKGVATNREALVKFKEVLETSGVYESVSLPLASLASEKNAGFEIKLVLKK